MDRFSHNQEKIGEVYRLKNDRFRKKRSESITGEILSASIGEARGSAAYITDKINTLSIRALKDNFNTIKNWCQEEKLFSDRIGEVKTHFSKYKHLGVAYDQELKPAVLTLAKEVLHHISEQSPRSLNQGSLLTPNNVRDAIDRVGCEWEAMSVQDLRNSFDIIKEWHVNNDPLLRENLNNDEIKEIDIVSNRINSLLNECNNVYHTLSSDDQHNIAKNVLEYAERVEAPFRLADVWMVGKDKPMGDISTAAFEYCTFIKKTRKPIQIIEILIKRGLHVLINNGIYQESNPNLEVYDYEALEDLLRAKAPILKEAGWPTDPNKFVQRVASETVPKKTKLYDVIADAFADYNNPGRTDIAASSEE